MAWASRRPVGRPPASTPSERRDAALAVGPGDQRATKKAADHPRQRAGHAYDRARGGCRSDRAPRARPAPRDSRWQAPRRSLPRQLVLVEDALVEAWRQAHVVDVAWSEVHTARSWHRGTLVSWPDQRLEEVRRLDGDRTTRSGHIEMRAHVAPQVRVRPERRSRADRHRRRWRGPGDERDGVTRAIGPSPKAGRPGAVPGQDVPTSRRPSDRAQGD